VGPAISWAVDELELRAGDGVLRSPAPGYPPPLVRLALLAAITGETPGAGSPDPAGGPLAKDVAGLLTRVPEVAAALLTVPVGAQTLGFAAAKAAAWRQATAVWRRQLTAAAEPRPAATLEAARLCVAGGVAAWRDGDGQDAARAARLSRRLLATVPECGPSGVRAATAPPSSTVRQAARAVSDVLFSAAVEEDSS
jgi:hypothetical protein